MEILRDQDIRAKAHQPLRKRAGIFQRQHRRDADAHRKPRRAQLGQRLPALLQRGRLWLEHLADRFAIGRDGQIHAHREQLPKQIDVTHHQRAARLDQEPGLIRNQGFQNATGEP